MTPSVASRAFALLEPKCVDQAVGLGIAVGQGLQAEGILNRSENGKRLVLSVIDLGKGLMVPLEERVCVAGQGIFPTA